MIIAATWVKRGAGLLAIGALVFAVGAWLANRPPRDAVFGRAANADPLQTAPRLTPFHVEHNGHRYDLEPIHAYELRGLIVTAHDSDSFIDTAHEEWNDFLNIKDICVLWGDNLDPKLLSKLSFWSGNWTCYVKTNDGEAWKRFRPDQLSNNHVLPATPEIARRLREARVGDEIRIQGHLVNYSIDGGPARKSSVERRDTGNGACEIVYVEEIEITARHNLRWTRLRQAGLGTGATGAFLIVIGAFVLPFFRRD